MIIVVGGASFVVDSRARRFQAFVEVQTRHGRPIADRQGVKGSREHE
ncbi:hypothetical protein [Nannocystis exedens]|nr:hypothetical protein [Nannocystis exedens]